MDDSRATRRLVRAVLDEAGLGKQVAEVATAAEAVVRARTDHFDLILMDYHLPDMQASELLKGLRGAGVGTRVLILSGTGSMADVQKALAQGASGFVSKDDIIGGVLVAAVRDALRKR